MFCWIVDHANEPASFLAEEEHAAAFLDVQPINDGHALIVPRSHAHALAELDEASAVAIWSLARRVTGAIRKSGIRCEGIDVLLADGEAAGREVPHVHLHVIPRCQGDGFGFRFPERHRDRPERSRLDDVAERVRPQR